MCPELVDSDIILTNAKGVFSSTLAEYAMAAISYFTKFIPQLMKQKEEKLWNKFNMIEIKGLFSSNLFKFTDELT